MAGTIYPQDEPRSCESRAEGKVYRALKKALPDGWTAWHSLRLCGGGEEGEGDFVLAVPGRGLVVLEVKAGRIELRDGHWLQNGKRLRKAPMAQARGFAGQLVHAIAGRGAPRPAFGTACVFCDEDFLEGPPTGDLEGLVLGQMHLQWLEQALPAVVDRALDGRSPARDDGWIRAMHELWGETWVARVRLADRVEDAARRAVALNREQLQVLDVAGDNPRALVEGGAGTGKSIVARELVVRRARAGRRAMYLCFTDALARAVDHTLEEERRSGHDVRAVAIRRYASALIEATGRPLPPPTAQFWSQVSLDAACEALGPATSPPFVVVDEAQDLEYSDWMLVEALVGKAGPLWVFRDSRQQFWREREAPASILEHAARLTLTEQLRSPEIVRAFADLYAAPGPLPGGPVDAGTLRVVVAADPLDRVRHELDCLRRVDVAASDIAVLSLAGQTRSQLFEDGRLGSHVLAHADAADAATRTIGDTFLRFKGLDRPFVIVTELVHGEGMKYETRMHIALTRATVAAIVVCDKEAVGRDERLAWLGRAARS